MVAAALGPLFHRHDPVVDPYDFLNKRKSRVPVEYQDPSIRPDQVDVWVYSSGKDEQEVIEKRVFNRFQDDEVPTRARRRMGEKRSMGAPVKRREGDKCWTEQKFEVNEYLTPCFMKKRWIEYWRIDEPLKRYYEGVDGFENTAKAVGEAATAPLQFIFRAAGAPSLTPGTVSAAGIAGYATQTTALGLPALAEIQGAQVVGSAVLDATVAGARAASTAGRAAGAITRVAGPAVIGVIVFVAYFVTTTHYVKSHKKQKAAQKLSGAWEFVGVFDGPEYLEKTSIKVEKVFYDCPKPKPSFLGWLQRWWLWILLLLIATAILLAAIAFFSGRSSSRAPTTTSAATTTAATTPTTIGATTTLTVPIAAQPGGVYQVTVSIGTDPGHSAFIGMPQDIELTVMTGSIAVAGPEPWVSVIGEIDEVGNFTASGHGTVAGFPDVSVLFEGKLTETGLSGDYTMGANGELPGGEAMVYNLAGQRVEDRAQETVEGFTSELQTARQTGDIVFLLSHLHPFVIRLYGLDACYEYLPSVFDPEWEFETLEVSNPIDWIWDHDGVVETIPDVYSLSVIVAGTEEAQDFHFGATDDGLLRWFTDCGDPLS